MLSVSQKKIATSLKQKKFRNSHNSFVVEGVKMVDELLESNYEVELIFATQSFIKTHPLLDVIDVSEKELASISSLKTANQVLAIVKKKQGIAPFDFSQLTIALDNIQDPGNMGTIIRLADWFGISTIVCSEGCVDVFNPKVIQATMGSFFRVNVIYTDLPIFFTKNKELTVFGALLDGENIYSKKVSTNNSVLLIGNESKGISDDLQSFVNEKITIPKLGNAESLNAATAAAILCSEFYRT